MANNSITKTTHQYIKILTVCLSVCVCVCVTIDNITEVGRSWGGTTLVTRDLHTTEPALSTSRRDPNDVMYIVCNDVMYIVCMCNHYVISIIYIIYIQ